MGDRLVDYETAARFLGVHVTTVSDYANMGLLERHKVTDADGRSRIMFNEDDLLTMDEQYPVGPSGVRSLGKVARPSRNIRQYRLSNGELRYRLTITVDGESYNRTFKTLHGAQRHRDRYLEQVRAAGKEPERDAQDKPSLFRRIMDRLNTEPWKAVGNG